MTTKRHTIMTIAVTGATGQLGRLIVSKLMDKVPADGIVALVRSPEEADGLGVAARAFDYSKPGTLGAALDGVDTVMPVPQLGGPTGTAAS